MSDITDGYKEKVRIIIDKWMTEDDYEIYRITDVFGEPADFTGNGGFVMYESNVQEILDNYSDAYDIEIVEDYR